MRSVDDATSTGTPPPTTTTTDSAPRQSGRIITIPRHRISTEPTVIRCPDPKPEPLLLLHKRYHPLPPRIPAPLTLPLGLQPLRPLHPDPSLPELRAVDLDLRPGQPHVRPDGRQLANHPRLLGAGDAHAQRHAQRQHQEQRADEGRLLHELGRLADLARVRRVLGQVQVVVRRRARRVEERLGLRRLGADAVGRGADFVPRGRAGRAGGGAVVGLGDLGLQADEGDVDGAQHGPVAAVEGGDVDVRVVVDDGEGGVVEGARGLGGLLAVGLQLEDHAGVDVLVVGAVLLAAREDLLERGGGGGGVADGVDGGAEVGWVGDDLLEEVLVGVDDVGDDEVSAEVQVDVPAELNPLGRVEEAGGAGLEGFHDQGVAAGDEDEAVDAAAVAGGAAEADQVAGAAGVFDPGVPVGAVEDFVEGEEDRGGEGVGGEAFGGVLQGGVEFEEGLAVDAARGLDQGGVVDSAAEVGDGEGADGPHEGGGGGGAHGDFAEP